MHLTNCVVSISRMTGDQDERKYQVLATGIKALLVPASNDIVAMMGDVPVGGLYSFLIRNLTDRILPEDKIEVTNPQTSAIPEGKILTVSGVSRETVVLHDHLIEGVAVVTD